MQSTDRIESSNPIGLGSIVVTATAASFDQLALHHQLTNLGTLID
jgi:hypothetical protein